MDNVQSKIGFLQSNPWKGRQFVRLFMLVKKNLMQSFRFKIFKGSTLLAFVNKKGKRQNDQIHNSGCKISGGCKFLLSSILNEKRELPVSVISPAPFNKI